MATGRRTKSRVKLRSKAHQARVKAGRRRRIRARRETAASHAARHRRAAGRRRLKK